MALVARGLDMDQLRSRSALSRAAGAVEQALAWPHDAVGRALGRGWVLVPGAIPALLVASWLAWGAALYAFASVVRRRA